ncbi:MAG: 2-succinyl-5-enolpyruvyl-6-hydroxy-3-cyclohexene-1-carboxylic-acid synthase [Solirubrobacterales bacterium]|nr:2-succinyl-5-enolpyruvyl-6-hydroxy-3-cyclohexene-1-carboxylic-acid synthase [Solirubrobacterales bacterium]
MTTEPATQANALAAFAARLAQLGVQHAVLSPGSRSAPLILALANTEALNAWSLIDEREAGFFALGTGKANNTPAVVACTSGTAAAELAPAVHEAAEAGTPLIVLTADRPPELRAAGENQTIDQIGVFGSAAPTVLGPPFSSNAVSQWIAFADEVFAAATGTRPGPVHVNVPLWDPLAQGADPGVVAAALEVAATTVQKKQTRAAIPPAVIELLLGSIRPLVICGRDERGLGAEVATWCSAAQIPVIADPLAQSNLGTTTTSVPAWDALIRTEQWLANQDPDLILRTGDLPTSKPLRAWLTDLAERGVPIVQFDPEGSGRDPISATTSLITARITDLDPLNFGDSEPNWLQSWLYAGTSATQAIDSVLSPASVSTLSEPGVIRTTCQTLQANTTLMIAASMPVRDLETLHAGTAGPACVANRGANGIDGTIATAAGYAAATTAPTVLICGDVTFAHDVAGLAAARESASSLLIVVLDNGGGAIFDYLPISQQESVYERFVFTPPRLDFSAAAQTWGIPYAEITSTDQLVEELSAVSSLHGPRVALIRVGRHDAQGLRTAIWAAVANQLAD